jgi:hypothetical protein
VRVGSSPATKLRVWGGVCWRQRLGGYRGKSMAVPDRRWAGQLGSARAGGGSRQSGRRLRRGSTASRRYRWGAPYTAPLAGVGRGPHKSVPKCQVQFFFFFLFCLIFKTNKLLKFEKNLNPKIVQTLKVQILKKFKCI